jgi:GTP-binding protein
LFAGAGDETAVALADKPRLVAANKIDAMDEPERLAQLEAHVAAQGVPLYPISSATGEGLPALLEAMWREVAKGQETTDP